jgi:mannose-6-phosphate isomerase-like protein (cupin superfamily)
MAKKKDRAGELERGVEKLLRGADAPAAGELATLLGVASELRNLPRAAFRAGLALALRPALEARDLREETRALGGSGTRFIGSLDRASIVLSKFSGLAPWERHPDGDELIVVLEGGGDITVLTDDGPVRSELAPGRLFVCPKGLWHRAHAELGMTALYVTPLAGGEHSFAEDPRTGSA